MINGVLKWIGPSNFLLPSVFRSKKKAFLYTKIQYANFCKLQRDHKKNCKIPPRPAMKMRCTQAQQLRHILFPIGEISLSFVVQEDGFRPEWFLESLNPHQKHESRLLTFAHNSAQFSPQPACQSTIIPHGGNNKHPAPLSCIFLHNFLRKYSRQQQLPFLSDSKHQPGTTFIIL